MEYISFCSGIEAASQAWHPLGWKPLAFCEVDKNASRILSYHYPNVPNLGDFTQVDWSQWCADICVGGTPCQAFSVAGLRKSLSDERGNLSLEFIRAVNIIRPRFVVWENVPGVLSTADNAFGCFLAGLVGCEEPIVFEQGWPNAGVVDGPIRRCAWRVLDAQYFGLAQRRKRVFVVASAGDGPHPAEILFEWESLRRDSPPSRETGEGAAGTIAAHTHGDGRLGIDFECDGGFIPQGFGGAIAPTLNSAFGSKLGLDNQHIDSGAGLFVAHSLRADGFDASEDGTGRGTPLVPVAIQAGALRENPNSGPDGVGVQGHIAYTLEARAEVHAVAFDAYNQACSEVTHTRRRGTGPSGDAIPQVVDRMAVRRLTPRECERLQGFPDDYTLIPGAADGPRYKALGNSMAVPVMAWIGRKIQQFNQK